MGRYGDNVLRRMRGQATILTRSGRPFEGAFLSCPRCGDELLRREKGDPWTKAEGRAAKDEHEQTCPPRRVVQ